MSSDIIIPSIYQQDFYDCVQNSTSNILLSATAGSGKTTTALECLNYIPKLKSSIFLSFSNTIVSELKHRVPSHVEASTLHSLGCRSIMGSYPGVKIYENKFFQLAIDSYPKKDMKKELFIKCYNIQSICNMARVTLTPLDVDRVVQMCIYYDMEFDEEMIEKSIDLIQKTRRLKHIDFADMIYIPATNPKIIEKAYDYIIIDEVQDCNKAQKEFIENLLKVSGRLISIGDPHQCQPAGTKIQMADKSLKNIEDIIEGDFVTSYDLNYGSGYQFYYKSKVRHDTIKHKYIEKNLGGIVKERSERLYTGKLFTIKTEEKESSYTLQHKCCFRFHPSIDSEKKWVVYMMEKDRNYRIGVTVLWEIGTRENSFGLSSRCRGEYADRGWLLEVFDTKEDAKVYEQIYSYKFGIPQFIFSDPLVKGQFLTNQTVIDKFWSLVDKSELFIKAQNCLKYFGRDIQYPLYKHNRLKIDDEKGCRNSKLLMFYTEPCNLIGNLMQVSEFDPNFIRSSKHTTSIVHKWETIKEVEIEEVIDLPVYSLKVSGSELYVGDGILTHNSIYSFLGANTESFEQFKNRPNTIQLPLSISYRCAKKIVEEAQPICSTILPSPTAKEGVVREGKWTEIEEGDMVVCRNNAPLVSLYFNLLDSEVKCYIKGQEIEKSLINIAQTCMTTSESKFLDNLEKKLKLVEDELKKKGVSKPLKHPRYLSLMEKVEVILLVLNKVLMPTKVIPKIKEIFDESRDGVKLLSIHGSKGLENKRVFFIRDYNGTRLIPSKYATMEWQLKQEQNLLFVAITRAKEELIYLSLVDN